MNHDPPFGVSADREGLRTAGAMMRAAFPDWHSDQHLVVGEGDIVVEPPLDPEALREEVLGRLRRLVPVDAAFFATVDPETLLFTSVLVEEPLRQASALFLDNEFGRDDVNKFSALASGDDPVSSLDRATGRRPAIECPLRRRHVAARAG